MFNIHTRGRSLSTCIEASSANTMHPKVTYLISVLRCICAIVFVVRCTYKNIHIGTQCLGKAFTNNKCLQVSTQASSSSSSLAQSCALYLGCWAKKCAYSLSIVSTRHIRSDLYVCYTQWFSPASSNNSSRSLQACVGRIYVEYILKWG